MAAARQRFSAGRPVAGLALALWCGLVVACETVPTVPKPRAAADTLLVVPVELTNEIPSTTAAFYYAVLVDRQQAGGAERRLDAQTGYSFVTGLEPGNHVVTSIVVRYQDTGMLAAQYEASLPFVLVAGQMTVLPYRFTILLRKDEQGRAYQYLSAPNLLASQLDAIRQDLRSYRNTELWLAGPTGP